MTSEAFRSHRHSTLSLWILPLRKDNYSYVIHDEAEGATLVIDPSETQPIIDWLDKQKLGLDWILDTHHHNDHTEGNVGLKARFGAKIAASAFDIEQGRIGGGPDTHLRDGETFAFGDFRFRIIATPGHTLGHVCLYLEEAGWLFSGDTLFSLGCGRLFEGDGPMLWQSFQKLAALPDETLVFCGHEYTLDNAAFALSILPDFEGLASHVKDLRKRRDEEGKTIPTLLKDEKRFNPYFLAGDARLAKFGSQPADVFSQIRALKNDFR